MCIDLLMSFQTITNHTIIRQYSSLLLLYQTIT